MSSQAVDAVLARFRGRGGKDDLAGRRTAYDRAADDQAMPEGARFERTSIGGAPAERVTVAGADAQGCVLYFHGGGYVVGSAAGYRALTATLATASGLQVLGIDYRLAPEHPFPAAVEDAIVAYQGLLDQGMSASSIGFAGDSAGGGLVVAAMLAAREAGLPMPAAGYGLSPWLDLTGEGASFTELAAVDPLMTAEGALGSAAAYLQGADPRHPWASPVFAELSGLPPLLLQVGSTEMFLDDSTRLARSAALAGVHVELQVWPGLPHVWHRFPGLLEQGRRALASGGRFLRESMC